MSHKSSGGIVLLVAVLFFFVFSTSVYAGSVDDAYWSKSTANDGDYVTLTLKATGLDGKKATITIYEDDPVFNDEKTTKTLTVSGGKASTSWTAKWEDDGWGGGDPEFFFKVEIEDGWRTRSIKSDDMTVTCSGDKEVVDNACVRKKAPPPSPRPTPTYSAQPSPSNSPTITPQPSHNPTPTYTPQPSNSPVNTLQPSPQQTNKPPEVICGSGYTKINSVCIKQEIKSVSWWGGKTYATEGDSLLIDIQASGFDGQTATVEIWEDDFGPDDYITTITPSPVDNGVSRAVWSAMFVDDGWLGGNSEYYIKATIGGQTVKSGDLEVKKREVVCGSDEENRNGVCVKKEITCGANEEKKNGVCVKKEVVCKPWEVSVNGQCVACDRPWQIKLGDQCINKEISLNWDRSSQYDGKSVNIDIKTAGMLNQNLILWVFESQSEPNSGLIYDELKVKTDSSGSANVQWTAKWHLKWNYDRTGDPDPEYIITTPNYGVYGTGSAKSSNTLKVSKICESYETKIDGDCIKKSISTNLPANAIDGQKVPIKVETTGFLDGTDVIVEVWEFDPYDPDDKVATITGKVNRKWRWDKNQNFSTSWVAKWSKDHWLGFGKDPEYYLVVNIGGEKYESNRMAVVKNNEPSILETSWSKQQAGLGEPIQMVVKTYHIADGTPITLNVYERDGWNWLLDDDVSKKSGTVQNNQVNIEWKASTMGDQYANPEFYFRASVGGLSQDSGYLRVVLTEKDKETLKTLEDFFKKDIYVAIPSKMDVDMSTLTDDLIGQVKSKSGVDVIKGSPQIQDSNLRNRNIIVIDTKNNPLYKYFSDKLGDIGSIKVTSNPLNSKKHALVLRDKDDVAAVSGMVNRGFYPEWGLKETFTSCIWTDDDTGFAGHGVNFACNIIPIVELIPDAVDSIACAKNFNKDGWDELFCYLTYTGSAIDVGTNAALIASAFGGITIIAGIAVEGGVDATIDTGITLGRKAIKAIKASGKVPVDAGRAAYKFVRESFSDLKLLARVISKIGSDPDNIGRLFKAIWKDRDLAKKIMNKIDGLGDISKETISGLIKMGDFSVDTKIKIDFESVSDSLIPTLAKFFEDMEFKNKVSRVLKDLGAEGKLKLIEFYDKAAGVLDYFGQWRGDGVKLALFYGKFSEDVLLKIQKANVIVHEISHGVLEDLLKKIHKGYVFGFGADAFNEFLVDMISIKKLKGLDKAEFIEEELKVIEDMLGMQLSDAISGYRKGDYQYLARFYSLAVNFGQEAVLDLGLKAKKIHEKFFDIAKKIEDRLSEATSYNIEEINKLRSRADVFSKKMVEVLDSLEEGADPKTIEGATKTLESIENSLKQQTIDGKNYLRPVWPFVLTSNMAVSGGYIGVNKIFTEVDAAPKLVITQIDAPYIISQAEKARVMLNVTNEGGSVENGKIEIYLKNIDGFYVVFEDGMRLKTSDVVGYSSDIIAEESLWETGETKTLEFVADPKDGANQIELNILLRAGQVRYPENGKPKKVLIKLEGVDQGWQSDSQPQNIHDVQNEKPENQQQIQITSNPTIQQKWGKVKMNVFNNQIPSDYEIKLLITSGGNNVDSKTIVLSEQIVSRSTEWVDLLAGEYGASIEWVNRNTGATGSEKMSFSLKADRSRVVEFTIKDSSVRRSDYVIQQQQPKVDLVLEEIQISGPHKGGSYNLIQFVVKNLGTSEAKNVQWKISYSKATKSNKIPKIKPGESVIVLEYIQLPAEDNLEEIKIMVDPENKIAEINEDNTEVVGVKIL